MVDVDIIAATSQHLTLRYYYNISTMTNNINFVKYKNSYWPIFSDEEAVIMR